MELKDLQNTESVKKFAEKADEKKSEFQKLQEKKATEALEKASAESAPVETLTIKESVLAGDSEIDGLDIDPENTYEKRIAKRGRPVWNDVSLLDIPAAIQKKLDFEGYVGRWVSQHQYEKRLLEGWEPVMVGGKKYTISGRAEKKQQLLTGTGDLGGSETRMREMILMKIPLELAEARREHNKKLTSDLLASKVDEALPAGETRTGTITINKG